MLKHWRISAATSASLPSNFRFVSANVPMSRALSCGEPASREQAFKIVLGAHRACLLACGRLVYIGELECLSFFAGDYKPAELHAVVFREGGEAFCFGPSV